MANIINNKRYNKLLSYMDNYSFNGSQMQNDPYRLNGRYSTPAIVEGMGGAENPNQGYEAAIETQPIDNNKSWLGNLGKSLKEGFQSGAFNGVAGALGTMTGNAISGGLSSTADSTLNSLSGLASAIPGPWSKLTSVGLGIVRGVVNRINGTKFNKENIANVEGNINRLNNFQSNANSFDTLADTWGNTALGTGFSNSYIGKDGWFSTKAKRKANNLREQLNEANLFALDTLQNNADNITETTMNNLEANYAALGGFLNQYSDGGSIYIKPENRGKFNATKKRTGKTTEELTHSKNPLTRKRAIFAQNAKKWRHEDGGELGLDGMIKAKLALASHFGNPTARRMTNYDTRSYTFPNNERGNVYVGSYGEYVTPHIQDVDGELKFIENPWSEENWRRSEEQSIKFESPRDAEYFAKNYKRFAPMMSLYSKGGNLNNNSYQVGQVYDVDEEEYKRLIKEGYGITRI